MKDKVIRCQTRIKVKEVSAPTIPCQEGSGFVEPQTEAKIDTLEVNNATPALDSITQPIVPAIYVAKSCFSF